MLIREIRVFEGFETVEMEINVEKKLRKIVDGEIKGFTTIELIIVIVIAGIMAAIAIPKLANNNIDLYSVARQVKSDIRYTQELAMSKYRKTTIKFTANSSAYTITGITQPRQLPSSSKATFNTTISFTFNSSGEPIGGGGTIAIGITSGVPKQIEVSSITGKARIL